MNYLKNATSTARFDPAELTTLKSSELVALRAYLPGAKVSDAVQAFVDTHKMPVGPNQSELRLINRAILDRERGTDATGRSYDERAVAKGCTVTYDKQQITITDSKGEEMKIANGPLPPAKPATRTGQGRLVAILAAFFDLDKGELTTIRAPTFEKTFFPPGSIYDPSGVFSVRGMLLELLKSSRVKGDSFTSSGTCRGHQATDFWYTFTSSLNMEDYMALYQVVLRDLVAPIKEVEPAKGKLGSMAIVVDKKTKKPSVDPKALHPFPRQVSQKYEKEMKAIPFYLRGTLPAKCSVPDTTSSLNLLKVRSAIVSGIGGSSRGTGLVGEYMDYCPRQTEVIRRVNWFLMAIYNIPDKRFIDVRVRIGDIALLTRSLKGSSREKLVNFIVSNEDKYKVPAGVPLTEGRHDACYVAISPIRLPDPHLFKNKEKEMEEAYDHAVRQEIPANKKYIIQMPVFTSFQFDRKNVFAHGAGHDLQATVTHEAITRLVDPSGAVWRERVNDRPTWYKMCREGMQKLICWPFSGGSVYSSLGTWFRLKGEVAVVSDGEWAFVEDVDTDGVPEEEEDAEVLPLTRGDDDDYENDDEDEESDEYDEESEADDGSAQEEDEPAPLQKKKKEVGAMQKEAASQAQKQAGKERGKKSAGDKKAKLDAPPADPEEIEQVYEMDPQDRDD